MAKMPAIVMVMIVIVNNHYIPSHHRPFPSSVAGRHCNTRRAADSATDDCTIAPAYGRTNCSTRTAPQGSTKNRIAIHGFCCGGRHSQYAHRKYHQNFHFLVSGKYHGSDYRHLTELKELRFCHVYGRAYSHYRAL